MDKVSASCVEARRKTRGISLFATDGSPTTLARSSGRLCPTDTTELGLGQDRPTAFQRRRRLRRLHQRRIQEALQTHGVGQRALGKRAQDRIQGASTIRVAAHPPHGIDAASERCKLAGFRTGDSLGPPSALKCSARQKRPTTPTRRKKTSSCEATTCTHTANRRTAKQLQHALTTAAKR